MRALRKEKNACDLAPIGLQPFAMVGPKESLTIENDCSLMAARSQTRKCTHLLLVKKLPAMQETQVQFLGQEYPLEKEMATHCSIFA